MRASAPCGRALDRLIDQRWSAAIFWLRPADSCMPLSIGSDSCQPHPGTPNIRFRCSLPGLTGFTNIQLRGDRQESPLIPGSPGALYCQGNHASDASLIAMRVHMSTTNGRINTIPRPSIARVPTSAPSLLLPDSPNKNCMGYRPCHNGCNCRDRVLHTYLQRPLASSEPAFHELHSQFC